MSEDQDNEKRELPVDRQTIRDAIIAQAEAHRQEHLDRELAERRQARQEKTRKRREASIQEARDRKAHVLRQANQANGRVAKHVMDAGRSLRSALRDAQEVSFPRHSAEHRAQSRLVRALEDAINSLRRARGSNFDEADFDLDLDLDVG